MVKKAVTVFIVSIFLSISLQAENSYERNCIPCHQNLPTSLEQMFMSYLAAYSGEKSVKSILKYYLKNPNKSLSVMSDLFIDTYGIKDATKLDDDALDEAINIYWEKFKVFDKLK
jgi:hypothetical protein